jgi:hypothetical protein
MLHTKEKVDKYLRCEALGRRLWRIVEGGILVLADCMAKKVVAFRELGIGIYQ